MATARMHLLATCVALTCATSAIAQPPADTAVGQPAPYRTYRFLALPRFPEGFDGEPPGPMSRLNVDAVVPLSGPLFDRLNGGVSTGITFTIPLPPISPTPTDGSWSLGAGFRYLWLDGKNNVQLNQPGGGDFDIHDVNVYLATMNAEYDTEIPLASIAQLYSNNGAFFDDGANLILGAGVTGLIGGGDANVSRSRFDRTKEQILNPGPIRDDAVVGGYELFAKVGMRFPSGMVFAVRAGYGQLYTGLLQTDSNSNEIVTIGAGFSVPLPLRSNVFRQDVRLPFQRFNRQPYELYNSN